VIEVPPEEYWDLACNAVTLAPGKVVMNAGSPSVVRELERSGIEVIQVDFSESHNFAIAGSPLCDPRARQRSERRRG